MVEASNDPTREWQPLNSAVDAAAQKSGLPREDAEKKVCLQLVRGELVERYLDYEGTRHEGDLPWEFATINSAGNSAWWMERETGSGGGLGGRRWREVHKEYRYAFQIEVSLPTLTRPPELPEVTKPLPSKRATKRPTQATIERWIRAAWPSTAPAERVVWKAAQDKFDREARREQIREVLKSVYPDRKSGPRGSRK